MQEYKVENFVFLSSATVYGDQGILIMNENLSLGKTTNLYGTTKAMIENILEDLYTSENSWNICILI